MRSARAVSHERVRCALDCAGRIEWHALIHAVVRTDDRWATAAALARRFGNLMSTDEILATPFALIGTIKQMAEQILRNRERYGFTYYTVHGPYADTFAPVIERVHTISDW